MCNDDMLYICIFSNKLDLNQTIRVLHIIAKLRSKIGRVNKPLFWTLVIFYITTLKNKSQKF
jgi:hypothetical protein